MEKSHGDDSQPRIILKQVHSMASINTACSSYTGVRVLECTITTSGPTLTDAVDAVSGAPPCCANRVAYIHTRNSKYSDRISGDLGKGTIKGGIQEWNVGHHVTLCITVRNLIGQHSIISCNTSFIWQCDEGLIRGDNTATVSD
jgi:hypothetical protein